MTIPRPEHPDPQFERETWLSLNGEWQFCIDNGRSGEERGLFEPDARFDQKILVPFCPQSRLSGVGHTDFLSSVWYKRAFPVTPEQLSGDILLHFGAVDYEAKVYVNGAYAGEHRGGYVSFCLNITALCRAGENIVTVNALDDERSPMVPRGKQSEAFYSHGCDYTRTTGIWQSVWLEFAPKTRIEKITLRPDVENAAVHITALLFGAGELCVRAFFDGKEVGVARTACGGGVVQVFLPFSETHLWSAGQGDLYDLVLTYGEDTVKSYCALRSIRFDGCRFLLNGRSVFQRLILDQGFYPDGIYTAPSDDELKADIERSLSLGFNGARLHQKVFEQRFLYHADRLGYLVWGEYPSWGLDHARPEAIYSVLPEWLEELERDFNHPCIVGWCPFNETSDHAGHKQYDELLRLVYRTTKAIDDTRPCIDTSGYIHVETDVFDVHDYNQDPVSFKARYDRLMRDGVFDQPCFEDRQQYCGGKPVFVSEYGGIQKSDGSGWGYGSAPENDEMFLARYRGLTDALLDNSKMFAFCYTQLTDVEQEKNGLYTYDRQPKFDPAVIYAINVRKAAIEDE